MNQSGVVSIIKNAWHHPDFLRGSAVECLLRAQQSGDSDCSSWMLGSVSHVRNGEGNGNGGTVSEEGLRDWFGKSKSKDGKKGWVQVVSGKPCARQPGQKSTPKCVSSAKRASMSKSERASAQRRKRAADPGQPQKTGAAKPTYVSTDKPKMKSVKEATEFVTLPLEIEIPNKNETKLQEI